jgi:hypothetical protein
MGDVQAHTKAYLQDPKVSKFIDVLVKHLCGLSQGYTSYCMYVMH